MLPKYLTTGDKITLKEIKYNYNCIFEDNKIPIFAYNLETLISKKLETVISRNITNTRLKDFYDLEILLNSNYIQYDKKVLVEAIKNTFKKRNINLDINKIKKTLELIKTDRILKESWLNY